jgi:hypothetical protein
MEEVIKKIIDVIEDADEVTKKRILSLIGRNDALEVIYRVEQDSFGVIHITECPNCGETI